MGWRKFADENTFVDYFIINELSRNVDGYRISTYFHKDRYSRGGKIKAGPVWDYDIAFHNADYCHGSDTSGWAYRFNYACPNDPNPVNDWWGRLMSDTLFKNRLYCRWHALRSSTLSISHIDVLLDSIVALTASAGVRHFQQWPVLGQYVWPNPSPIPATYADEIQAMKNWLSSRMNWLDNNIPVTGSCAVLAVTGPGHGSILQADVFPNPVADECHIRIESAHAQTAELQVRDLSGRTVYTKVFRLVSGDTNHNISCHSWASGFYILEVATSAGEKLVRKIVKE